MSFPEKLQARFSVIAELGTDYRGTVYRVREKSQEVSHLVRIMDCPDPMDFDVLNRELADIDTLRHPNLAFIRRIEDLGRGRVAVFMDHKEGSWIAYHMSQLRENAEVFHNCVVRCAHALEYLHQHGLCHWDIRPETLLVHHVDGHFEVALIDTGLGYYFDLKKLRDQRDPKLHRAAMYMSPEIISGCGADYRSDLYSLGVVLFETATGSNPFEAPTTASVVSAQLNKTAPQAKEINPNVSTETNALILRLLAKESAFRPAGAAEVALEIASDLFQPSIPPRTGGVFKAHALPRREIQSAFEEACVGNGGVLTLTGVSGSGKTELLEDFQAEFGVSGASPVVIDAFDGHTGGVFVLRKMIEVLSREFKGLSGEFVDTLYFLNHDDAYLRLADRAHVDNIIRQSAIHLLSHLYLDHDELLDSPRIFVLRNCHFKDYIFWQFFQTIATLLNNQPEKQCPCLWIIETHEIDIPVMTLPSSRKYQRIELLPFDLDETNSMLSAQLGLTPFPEKPAQWVLRLSQGIPRRICLISDVMRTTRMVIWSDGDWILDNVRFAEVESFQDLQHLIDWAFNQQINVPQKVALTHLALWSRGCRADQLNMAIPENESETLNLYPLIFEGWVKRSVRDGVGIYKFRYLGLQQWIRENTPAYQRIQFQMQIADQLARSDHPEPDRIAEHYFEADNRLHGCEYATRAARWFVDCGEFHQAITWYQRILEEMPDRNRSKIAQISYEIGQMYLAIADFNNALAALTAAEPIMESRFHQKREKANYLMLIGLCHMELNDSVNARTHLEEAMEFIPKTTGLDYRLKILTYLSRSLLKTGDYKSVIQTFSDHQKLLPMDTSPYFAGSLMESVAKAYLEERDYPAAEFALKESIRHGEMLGDPLALIDRYLELGNIYERGHKYKQAEEEYERVITLARRGATRRGLAKGICHLVSLNLAQHKTGNVGSLLQEAADLAEHANDPALIAWSNILKSSLYIEEGKLYEAETILLSVEGLISDEMDLSLANRIYLNLAEIARRQANYFLALEYYDKLLGQVVRRKQNVFIAFTYLYKSQMHILLDHYDKAADFVSKARDILTELNLVPPDCDILEAHILLKQGQVKRARKVLESGLSEARDKNLLHQQAEAHYIKGLIEIKENHLDYALSELKAALDFYKATQEEFESAVVIRQIAGVYQDLGKHERARTENENADRIFKKLAAFQFAGIHPEPVKPERALARDTLQTRDLDLSATTRIIESLTQIPGVYDVLLDTVLKMIGLDRGAIFRKEENSDQLIMLTAVGLSARDVDAVNRLCSVLLFEKQLNEPVECDSGARAGSGIKSQPEKAWALPIKFHRNVIGLLYVDGKIQNPPLAARQLEPLSMFIASVLHTVSRFQNQDLLIRKLRNGTETVGLQTPIIDHSSSMKRVTDLIGTITHSLQPVLIFGEPGCGKSFIADQIHKGGRFRQLPLHTINCELFKEPGKAITLNDVIHQSVSALKSGPVHGGTIVLKNIEHLSREHQATLLEIISGEEMKDLPMLLNRRIISTTSVNLRKIVQDGRFSEDLYRLLSILSIVMPSLTERREDIPYLAGEFLTQASKTTGREFTSLSPTVIDALIHYDWPENTIELKNAIESAVLFGSPPTLELKDLPRTIRNHFERSGVLEADKPALRSLEEVEESHIRAILQGTQGNKLRACEILEISRPTLDRKLEKYDIKIEKKRKR